MKSSPKILDDAKRTECANALIAYFHTEFEMEIGLIAAEALLDHVIDNVGADIYNKGVFDARAVAKQHAEALDFDLDVLKKRA